MSVNKVKLSVYGVLAIIGVFFIILKLCNMIAWPWWAVTAFIWILPALIMVLLILTGVVLSIVLTMKIIAKII